MDNLPTVVDAATEQAVVEQDPVVISGPSSDTTLKLGVQALTLGVQAQNKH